MLIEGKDNYVEDALSRITINGFKQINKRVSSVLSVMIRSMATYKDCSKDNKTNKIEKSKILASFKIKDSSY